MPLMGLRKQCLQKETPVAKSKQQKRQEAAQRLRNAKFTDSRVFRILANEGHNLGSAAMEAAEYRWEDARDKELAHLEELR
jgi:hypothetical protein